VTRQDFYVMGQKFSATSQEIFVAYQDCFVTHQKFDVTDQDISVS
jgi:hypothetical protein